MKKIVVFGAGLSATYLIEYLENNAIQNKWSVVVADRDLDIVRDKCKSESTICVQIDIKNDDAVLKLIKDSDLVVSMLPAFLHIKIAIKCLELGINLATASYLSNEIKDLSEEAKLKNLVFLNECGLDPGIDHLSAMHLLDNIRNFGGVITEFESFTGGLLAPDCEDNPWKYKFTWNPRNVVLASSGGAVKFIHNGQYKFIPYQKVFRRTEIVEIDGYGKFEGYANRDSLKYRETYGLQDVKTMYRGTFRRPGFSKAWNCFVVLGATDDTYVLPHSKDMSHRDFINTFLAYHPTDSAELKLKSYLGIDQDDIYLWEKLESTGIFSRDKIGLEKDSSPAQILQRILEKKWSLKSSDRDLIVMWHKVSYEKDNLSYCTESSLVCEGESSKKTAMAKTVGLPLVIACKLILENRIKVRGSVLPITKEFYTPILEELKSFGISFKEKTNVVP
ncbi:saccharopine dehydrogenase NADP-binding domain-containing protein [Bacteroidia bacterium]|nr:saccharopine dehydrogenase NADP-binding domain-containing protein [Bacteroidia bacterium]MDC1395055.1 saccharopine dehydrogenase NADP-binding domain-containing protein [Bacteroidia bacterium]